MIGLRIKAWGAAILAALVAILTFGQVQKRTGRKDATQKVEANNAAKSKEIRRRVQAARADDDPDVNREWLRDRADK